MALADPISLALTGGTITLPRVSAGDGTSTYRSSSDDGGYVEVVISHTRGKRYRHVVRVNTAAVAEDPISETNVLSTASVTLTIDAPVTGIALADQVDLVEAIAGWLTASSSAKLVAITGGES